LWFIIATITLQNIPRVLTPECSRDKCFRMLLD